mmetsp:Transcript_33722/g.61064  ORF Transcript_33722/g.61064 Transcript_33722/m.61064 type:complete len:469 (-) Transcript_33722:51-1457(-)|eukprot:CAMPEP_0197661456 /NCGR_PEP_ID=MMETSP1338-20131121/51464_1 /TAXON_ID=43686 ORGANISM="Pelagodinium beii, Strain RCC1491" /NCGR_SAMPLE_ID=MMETSP1338 /ASSEMBLY_ACC=CAM_ASM_000754 /LENGTH=468 /DNA_ID=CAMNT_0043239013 /DNA_START=107 /DNA_END=1513 /DNA_ORIENTATION=+
MKIFLSFHLLAAVAATKFTAQDAAIQSHLLTGALGAYCDKVICPPQWTAKPDNHRILTGTTGEENKTCCLKTCASMNQTDCGSDYIKNEAYDNNTIEDESKAAEVCCDKKCLYGHTCKENYAIFDPHAPGTSPEECCKPKCKIYNCTGHFVLNESKKEVVGNDHKTCCVPSCEGYGHCAMVSGWVHNHDKNKTAGKTRKECCLPTCKNTAKIHCKHGWQIPPEREDWSNGTFYNKTNASETSPCCKQRCEAHKCTHGWTENASLSEFYGDTDEQCCAAACGQFECDWKEGWAEDPSKAKLALAIVGAKPEKCCQPTCKQWECPDEVWMTPADSYKENLTGVSNDVCCAPACNQHTCKGAGLVLIPESNKTMGEDDDVCCEPFECPPYRDPKLTTQMKTEISCNKITLKSECVKHFHVWNRQYNVTGENGTLKNITLPNIVPCTFDEVHRFCRFNPATALEGCKDFKFS